MEAQSTLREYVEAQDRLDREARQLFPYEFSACSYEQGYVKQQVFACLSCKPSEGQAQHGGVCYSCSISCHGDHELVELFHKRAFRCDCGSARAGPEDCCIRKNRIPLNEENKYNQNFDNTFCYCKKQYEPNTEDGTMFQCLLCEDWFHDHCIEASEALPDEDTFEYMICRECVDKESWLRRYCSDDAFCSSKEHATDDPTQNPVPEGVVKREAEDARHSTIRPHKKARTDIEAGHNVQAKPENTKFASRVSEPCPCLWAELPEFEARKRSLFLLEDFRERMCRCSSCLEDRIAHCPALDAEEDIYEPPMDEDDDNESTFDAGTRAMETTLQSMPRDTAIESILAYNKLKDHIASCLKPLAESGEIITKDHVRQFFNQG